MTITERQEEYTIIDMDSKKLKNNLFLIGIAVISGVILTICIMPQRNTSIVEHVWQVDSQKQSSSVHPATHANHQQTDMTQPPEQNGSKQHGGRLKVEEL